MSEETGLVADTRERAILEALEFYDENPRDRGPMEEAHAALGSLMEELGQFRAKLHTFGARANLEHNRAERLERELAELKARVEEMHAALVKADGSLTWCRARHANQGASIDTLREAIGAVLQITRRR